MVISRLGAVQKSVRGGQSQKLEVLGGEKSFLLMSFVSVDFERTEWDTQAGLGA